MELMEHKQKGKFLTHTHTHICHLEWHIIVALDHESEERGKKGTGWIGKKKCLIMGWNRKKNQSRSIKEITIMTARIIIEKGCTGNMCVFLWSAAPYVPQHVIGSLKLVMMSDETIRLVPEISSLKEKHVPDTAVVQRESGDMCEAITGVQRRLPPLSN